MGTDLTILVFVAMVTVGQNLLPPKDVYISAALYHLKSLDIATMN